MSDAIIDSPGRRAAARQSIASDPAVSAWVSASAGSGKTKLLTDRVLRLMLAGTVPSRILCLTFTKAAAAEMAVRLNRELGRWAVADDAALAGELAALLTRRPTPAEANRARTLFAEVLELAGGMRILTIHAFCQTLLRAFPLEASLPPQFTVLEEADSLAALADAREDVLGQAAGGPALDALAGLISADRFAGLSRDIAQGSGALEAALATHGVDAICDRLTAMLDAAASPDAALAAIATGADDHALHRAAAALCGSGNKADRDRGATMRAWIKATPAARASLFSAWREVFLTKDCTVKDAKFLATKGGLGAALQAEVLPVLVAEGERLLPEWRRLNAAQIVANTRALLLLAEPILKTYDQAKRRGGRLDFDDLITATRTLLTDPGSAWVLFKLDRGIDHVLLDEAQDSNPAQWGIVRALTAEFFAGEGASGAERSVFAVGDVKQSIFSFQGADPTGFTENQAYFSQAVEAAGGAFRPVELDVSFRSAPPVLALVDTVFADPGAAEGVVEPGALRHVAHRQDAAGLVELWPLLLAEQAEKPAPWEVREDATAAQAQTTLARALAARIRRMIEAETLPSRSDGPGQGEGRRIQPGDILILVRRRNALTRLIIRELKQAGVPVGGLDRIRLAEQIAVKDVLALIDVLLLPGDDLALAALLKSPLIGLDEDMLFSLAHGRQGRLHRALMTHRGGDGPLARAADWLAEWEGAADRTTPHALIARLLGADGGRARLLARLGPDATDGLDELLNAALAHEARHPPSLQGFVHWLRAGNAEVKREPEGVGGPGGGNVRIMTVHNAKGLQAPIVILPDTTGQKPREVGLRWAEDDLPLWAPRLDKPVCQAMRDLGEAEQKHALREENRLLYVALTRAEDRLLVCGWARQPGRNTEWYDQVRRGFEALGADAVAFDGGFGGDMLRHANAAHGPPVHEAGGAAAVLPVAALLPAWALTPAPAERAGSAASPSSLLDEETGPPAAAPHSPSDPRGVRFQRGRLIHALLQHLPALPLAGRTLAARRFLARPGHGLDGAVQDGLVAEAMALLEDPRFADAFGPDSLAEAPIAGRIGGRLLSGQVDRLLVASDRVLVIDYKSNRPPPATAAEVAEVYLRQMAAYRALLRLAFPGRVVEAALLWTYTAQLMPLPDDLLDAHAPAPWSAP